MVTREELRIILRTVAETQGAQQVSRSLDQVRERGQRARQSTQGIFDGPRESALRFAGALVGVDLGLSLVGTAGQRLNQLFVSGIQSQVDAQRVARATAASYGALSGQFTRFAAQLEARTGFGSQAILEAALSARTLSDNYGLTIQQTQRLISVSADLARIRGIGVAEAFERVQSAIRGEAEASEFLGLTLNDTFIRNNAMNGSLRNTFETMTDQQKAQVRYVEVLRQTERFQGLAAQEARGLAGAMREAELAGSRLSKTLGSLSEGPALGVLRAYADAANALASGLAEIGRSAATLPSWVGTAVSNSASIAGRVAALSNPLGSLVSRTASTAVSLAQARSDAQAREARERERAEAENRRLRALNDLSFSGRDFGQDRIDRARADRELARLREINELPTRDTAAEAARVAFLDQLEAGTRDLITAQREQNDLQRQSIQLAAQEAEIRLRQLPAERALADLQRQQSERAIQARLASLPATEALQDVQARIQRDRLAIQAGVLSPEERSAARREIRQLSRRGGELSQAELAAFDASRGVTLAERAGTRLDLQGQLQQLVNQGQLAGLQEQQQTNQLLLSINRAVEQTAQQRVEEMVARAIKEGLAQQGPMHVTITVNNPDGSQQVFDQLIEAGGQAQLPPVIQVSGVRR